MLSFESTAVSAAFCVLSVCIMDMNKASKLHKYKIISQLFSALKEGTTLSASLGAQIWKGRMLT